MAGTKKSAPPETIALTKSQRYSLNAFRLDEARFTQSLEELAAQQQQIEAAIVATRKARMEVLAEVASKSSVEVETLASGYIYNGNELIKAG